MPSQIRNPRVKLPTHFLNLKKPTNQKPTRKTNDDHSYQSPVHFSVHCNVIIIIIVGPIVCLNKYTSRRIMVVLFIQHKINHINNYCVKTGLQDCCNDPTVFFFFFDTGERSLGNGAG